jgi:WD40 repeat protein
MEPSNDVLRKNCLLDSGTQGSCPFRSLSGFPKLNFEQKDLKQMEQIKIEKDFCLGTRAISFNPKNPDQLAILDSGGNILLFDSKEEKTIRRAKCRQATTYASLTNSISFSPSGDMFFVSIYSDSSISFYRTKDFKKISHWNRKKTGQNIRRVRWLNESQVIASFGSPGVIEVVEFSSGTTLMMIEPGLTKESGWISDFDVSPAKKEIICCGQFVFESMFLDIVFKVRMEDGVDSDEWRYHEHSGYLQFVKYSNCGKFVLSGGTDNTIVLASEKDGSVLQKEEKWLSSSIECFFFSPNEQNIIVQSWNELVIIGWKENKKMEKTQEIKKTQITSSPFFLRSVNVF